MQTNITKTKAEVIQHLTSYGVDSNTMDVDTLESVIYDYGYEKQPDGKYTRRVQPGHFTTSEVCRMLLNMGVDDEIMTDSSFLSMMAEEYGYYEVDDDKWVYE